MFTLAYRVRRQSVANLAWTLQIRQVCRQWRKTDCDAQARMIVGETDGRAVPAEGFQYVIMRFSGNARPVIGHLQGCPAITGPASGKCHRAPRRRMPIEILQQVGEQLFEHLLIRKNCNGARCTRDNCNLLPVGKRRFKHFHDILYYVAQIHG